jgi:PAS domain S-box-containing protein
MVFSEEREGIWSVDVAGRTVFANARMAEILGTTVDEMIGGSSFDFVFPEDKGLARRIYKAKRRGDLEPFDFRVRRKDGSALWVHVSALPLKERTGAVRGVLGTFHVVTKAAIS